MHVHLTRIKRKPKNYFNFPKYHYISCFKNPLKILTNTSTLPKSQNPQLKVSNSKETLVYPLYDSPRIQLRLSALLLLLLPLLKVMHGLVVRRVMCHWLALNPECRRCCRYTPPADVARGPTTAPTTTTRSRRKNRGRGAMAREPPRGVMTRLSFQRLHRSGKARVVVVVVRSRRKRNAHHARTYSVRRQCNRYTV